VRVVGYLRVSTDRQAEDGFGLEVQDAAVRAWAKAGGHTLVGFHRDEGVSGSNGLDSRRGLPEALEQLRDKRADALVVYRLDRLARDLIIQETLLAEVRRLGGHVFSTSAAESGYLADDPEDPSRKLIRQVLGAVSEYERSMIALRLRSGRRRKAENGGFAYGSPAFGQRADGRGGLVADPGEQAAVDRIRQLIAEGVSLREMAATLTAEGYRPKRADRWHPESLRRIVARLTEGAVR
jgi:DNA invertase Pin-like site-specific DNA recombinase